MSEHLSADQISEWVAGERSGASEHHIQGCETCRSEIEAFQTTLGGFRRSVRSWSEAQYGIDQRPAWRLARPRNAVHPRLYWAAMAAAFCALMAVLVLYDGVRRPIFPGEAHSSTADAVLMRQVDADVSQTVPDAMEPLMKLVSWDDPSSSEAIPVTRHAAREEE